MAVRGRIREESIPVVVGQNQILKFYPSRKSFVVTNTTPNDIYLSTTNKVNPQRGIKMGPGGTVGFNEIEDTVMPQYEWWVYATGTGFVETFEVIDDGSGVSE